MQAMIKSGRSAVCIFPGTLNSSWARDLVVAKWLWSFARHRVIMSASVIGNVILPAVQSAPARCLIEELGSVKACRLTRRAADVGESPRFLGLSLNDRGFPFLNLVLARRS